MKVLGDCVAKQDRKWVSGLMQNLGIYGVQPKLVIVERESKVEGHFRLLVRVWMLYRLLGVDVCL